MNAKLIYSILYFIGSVTCFSVWKKYKDKDWLWFVWLATIGGSIELINYFLSIFNASPNIIFIGAIFIRIFALIEILVLAWIGFKMLMRNR